VVESLLKHLRAAVDQGNWVFRGLSSRLPTFPQLDDGYIRHSKIDLLHNEIGEYRAVEITPRAFTMEEQCIQIMRRLMVADPARELTKPQIYASVRQSLPGIRVGALRDL